MGRVSGKGSDGLRLRKLASPLLLAILALASCGAPPDGTATRESTEPTDTLPAATSSVVPVTTTVEPARSLQLCEEVPLSETAIMGDDPSGGELDPIFQGVLLTYAQEHDDTFGGMWLDRQAYGTVVLAFTDDPVSHREGLAQRRPSPDDVHPVEPMPAITDDRPIGEWGVAFDVVQVAFTEAELVARTIDISDALKGLGLQSFGAGADLTRNRVSVVLAQAPTGEEVSAMEAAIEAVVSLEMVCLEGTIVDARPDPIAPGTPLDVIVLPDANGMYPSDTEVECNGVQFTLGDLQSLTPIEDADASLQAVVDGWINGPGGSGSPADGWVVLTETGDQATLVRIIDDGMSVIGAEMGRNGWIWAGASGGGPCDVKRRLPTGMGNVKWVIDAAFPAPDTTSTELHVLAMETACTGGSELGDRLLGPQVVETADTVRVVFASIPLLGGQNCPSNPPTPVTITLKQPLGDRQLSDGLNVGSLSDLLAATA